MVRCEVVWWGWARRGGTRGATGGLEARRGPGMGAAAGVAVACQLGRSGGPRGLGAPPPRGAATPYGAVCGLLGWLGGPRCRVGVPVWG